MPQHRDPLLIQNDIFSFLMQDRVWKQQFFYNALRAFAVNRIDGDYAEFACWSATQLSGELRAMLEVFVSNERCHLLPYM